MKDEIFSSLTAHFKKTVNSDSAGWDMGIGVQLPLTLCDPMDHSPAGSSVHGILQARILGWVAMPCSRGSSQRRNPSPLAPSEKPSRIS